MTVGGGGGLKQQAMRSGARLYKKSRYRFRTVTMLNATVIFLGRGSFHGLFIFCQFDPFRL